VSPDYLEGDLPGEPALASFAARLETLAAGLPESERRRLEAIIVLAMDPLERMRWRKADSLLERDEESYLRSLLDEQGEQS
jgi:hypothetical protein